MSSMISTSSPDFTAVKKQQQQTWATGDYGMIGATLVIMAEQLCEVAGLHAGQSVLDVATGHGNTALAAARRFCTVTGLDYVPSLLERARERAAAERLQATFEEGDAEAMPFDDGTFDVVLSTVGVMFAPNHEQAARELVRVCRPGGKIGLASWTPDGFIGEVFRVIARHLPPRAKLAPAPLWGTEQHLRELFGGAIGDLHVTLRYFTFCYHSPQSWVDYFRAYYGPVSRAFAGLDPAGQDALSADLLDLAARYNRSGDATMLVPAEYLEAVATRTA